MGKKKSAAEVATCDIRILTGRVYLFTQKSQYFGIDKYEECLSILGAKVAAEIGPEVTHVVSLDGTLNKTTQKKVDSLQKKGATIGAISVDELRDHLIPSPKLAGEILAGTDADHAQLAELLRAYSHDMGRLPAETSDLSGKVFESQLLFNLCLRDTDFSNSTICRDSMRDVERCNFDEVDFPGGRFSKATDSSFRKANLQGGRVRGDLAGSTFEGADLQDSSIKLSVNSSRPSDAPIFASANLDRCKIDGINWKDADFSSCSAVASQWKQANAATINLNGADLSKCIMNDVDLQGADLRDVKFNGASLAGVDLRGAKLEGADFTGAILVKVTLDKDLDRSEIKGFDAAFRSTPKMGPALKKLDAAIAQAKQVKINLFLRPSSHVKAQEDGRAEHKMSFDATNGASGFRCFNSVHSPDGRLDMEHTDTFSEGFHYNLLCCAGAEVRFETITVKASKSPLKSAELRDLMIAVLAEAFEQSPPDEAELKALTKVYRAEVKKVTDAAKAEREKEDAKCAKLAAAEKKREVAKERAARPEPLEAVTDFATFAAALDLRADSGRVRNAQEMLKESDFQLFHDVSDPSRVMGVVKSQSDTGLVYACKLQDDGSFTCCTQNLRPCGGLRGAICKHQMVLLLGLVQAGVLEAAKMDDWVAKSLDHQPVLDKDEMSDVLLKYKGAEAGEIDWRPTETVPEDFYAF